MLPFDALLLAWIAQSRRSCTMISKGKGKVHPRTGPDGEQIYSSILSSTSALDGGWVINATPRPLYPRERPGTNCIGGWVDPRAGLDWCRKSRSPPGFDPRSAQPVASGYTEWAIPAPVLWSYTINCSYTVSAQPTANTPKTLSLCFHFFSATECAHS